MNRKTHVQQESDSGGGGAPPRRPVSRPPQTQISALACPPGALPGGPVRTRFFDGMFLTQADLETEQRYWRLKRRLTNRALGDGIVWGLKAGWNERSRKFALTPGYAIDCCGNDLVVECPVEVSETELWSRADPALRDVVAAEAAPVATHHGFDHTHDMIVNQRLTRHACLVLQYTECPEEARPVHRDACGGATSVCEPSRVRESARLVLAPPPRRVPTPPEQFLEELKAWANSLPPSVRDAVFPPQTGTTPPTATARVPMHVIVTVPGTPVATSDQQPPASGSTSPVSLAATQTPPPGRRTGVVTFELRPTLGYGFTAGSVRDGTRVVENVTPPVAPSMFWSFDLAIPDEQSRATSSFVFSVDRLDIAQVFGGSRHGEVDLEIKGLVSVSQDDGATDAYVEVSELVITTKRAAISDEGNRDQGCFRDVVPWGWTVEPRNGRRIASTLVLSAMYGFLSEVVRRGESQAWRNIATILYVVTWYALFGAFPMANVAEEHRRKLAELILDLYKRWCEGFAYPGPRCTDAHHGVYLGCAVIERGRIVSFDMWAHRRYVVTGALLEHWGHQLGIAPVDVVVGRFARALCCVSGLPPIVLPPWQGRLGPGIGGENADDMLHVGTALSAAEFAKERGSELRWVTMTELAARAPDAFLRREHDGAVEVLATTIEDGGTLAVAIPTTKRPTHAGAIRENVRTLTRHGELRVRENGRDALADFVAALFEAAPPTAAVATDASPGTHAVAKQLADRDIHLAEVVEGGSTVVHARLGSSTAAADIADLVDRAELALDNVVSATVGVLGTSFTRATFGDPAVQKKLTSEIASKALPGAPRDLVSAAAKKTASGT